MLQALLMITLCLTATALPAYPDVHNAADPQPDPRGLIINLDTGELCLFSVQCKSSCCHRPDGVSLARCAPRAAERETCSKLSLYGTYYFCPCEDGLKCDGDWSIGGSIVNSNFGTCTDPNAP